MKPESDPTWCGLKDDPNFVQCCCNCVYHLPVHYHCGHEPLPTEEQKKAAGIEGRCVCGVQKGWACVCLAMADKPGTLEGVRVHDNWPEHSCGCECYEPKSPNNRMEHNAVVRPRRKNKNMNIEKNIPMPDRGRNCSIATTLRTMSVGDSIVLPKGKDNGWRVSAKSIGYKVASRKISDTECRLWRVA
jgi:hypothetical protein